MSKPTQPAPEAPASQPAQPTPGHLGITMAIYLLGLLVGGLYVGMVAPVRTVVQEGFGITDSVGIWMITIYTLFYAALIPVIGKLADRHGSRLVFSVCLGCFAVGAALCGISAWVGGFPLLLVGRVVQAVGACGMIPVANAEMGTSFPPEKRGLALGLAAAVSGLANVLGSAVGSLVIGLVGAANWPVLFFGCIPLVLLALAGALAFVPRSAPKAHGRLDAGGALFFVLFVLGLLLALRDLDFFSLGASLAQRSVWAPLAASVMCLGAFVVCERRADEPIIHLEYLRSLPIVVTMVVSFFIGCAVVSMTIVPQCAEFLLDMPTGSGGYYVAVIGVFSLFGPPLAGKLVDRFGPKPILMAGLAVMGAGFAFLALVVAPHASAGLMIVGLAIVGLGMGFAMGAPTNYMILEQTSADQSKSAIATLTLVRQMGTSIAPAVFVGLIASAPGVGGYQRMLLAVAVFALAGLLVMVFYPHRAKAA